MLDRLKELSHNPEELKEKEKDFGFNTNPHSWLQDPGLNIKAMKVPAFDWMHCWCVNGVSEHERKTSASI